MIQIREGVFETNSSSSHSIVIKKDSHFIDRIDAGWRMGSNGILNIGWEDEITFERAPFDVLTDWHGRLRYALASFSYDPDKREEISEICARHIDGFNGFKFPSTHYGNGSDDCYYGYVDHQSSGLLQSVLNRGVTLEDFIFNDRYVVIIDGDEYCVFDRLINANLLNMDEIEKIVPDYDGMEDDGK